MIAAASPVPSVPTTRRALMYRPAFWAAAVGLLAFLVYRLSFPDPTPHNQYVWLADALLHSRVDLIDPPPHLEITTYRDRSYVINPPFPALLLLPYAALRGLEANQSLASQLCGGAMAAAFLLLAVRVMPRRADYLWLGLLGALGTILWYHTAVGSTWYFAHTVAVTSLVLGILETLGRGRPLLIGLAVAAAFWSRMPTILTLPFFLLGTAARWAPAGLRAWRRMDAGFLIRLAAPIAVVLLINGLYNWVRFGTIADVANAVRPGIFEEPWFQRGLFHPSYIPRHLRALFTALPPVVPRPPYLLVPWSGLAIWITTPAFAYALRAPLARESLAAWLGVGAVAAVDFMWGNPGISQFGYRFATDVYPLLFLLSARGMGERVPRLAKGLILAGVAVNAWGVVGTRLAWVAP